MARVLMCWELGNGLAYIESQAAHAKALQAAGHEVLFISRDLGHMERLLGDAFTYYQAPTDVIPGAPLGSPMTFADVLINLGYGRSRNVAARVRAWRNLFDLLEPDVVRCANSPAALLAARGTGIRTIVTGIGFSVPPPVSPLPLLRSWATDAVPERMAEREAQVLTAMNHALEALGAPRVTSVGALYHETDLRKLYSYPELDEYGPRDGVEYHGNFQVATGEAPVWPEGKGKRIFAYLELYEQVPRVLEVLAASGQPTLVYLPRPPAELRERYARGSLRITDRPVDLNQAAAQCDIGMSHGGHNIVASFLQAGKPQIPLPMVLTERVTAEKLAALGAGLMSGMKEEGLTGKLTRILKEPGFGVKAAEIGRRLSHYTVKAALQDTVDSVARLVKARG